jgi:hypothetical protein
LVFPQAAPSLAGARGRAAAVMPKPTANLKTLKRQGITILILVLALGCYLAVRVPSQRDFLTERNFRVLADMGRQINESLANLASSLANATRPPPTFEQLETKGSIYREAIRDRAAAARPAPLNFSNEVRLALNLVPALELLAAREPGTGTNHPPATAAEVTFAIQGPGGSPWLELSFPGHASNALVRARCDLDRLLQPIVSRGEFDEVLLVDARDATGAVVWQSGSSPLRVARLAVPSDRSAQTNLMNFGGADYLLFTQPLPAIAEGSPVWVLCGLARADTFAAQTRSISYTVLVMFTFLALLLVMSWPFLNVWSLGLKGGLRLGGVFLLIFSVVAVNAFLTLLALDLLARQRMQATTDQQLAVLGNAIKSNFETELKRAARQMLALNDRFLTNTASRTGVLTDLVDPFDAAATPYPHFGMANWLASDNGQQLAKWTVRERNTPLINVGRRAYFQTVAEGRGWALEVADGTNRHRLQFCLEPIFSANTGENLATLTLRPIRPTNDWQVVSALDCRMLALVNPVLPVGYGFCVVDARGQVLFHSDERRNLREDFFAECEQHPLLLAAVAGRQVDTFSARYSNAHYRLRVQAMPHVPWSLVVFRDKLVWGTAQVEILSVAVLMFTLYLTVLAMVIGLAYLVGARRSLAWLWPTPARTAVYGWLVVLNVLLVGGLLALVFLPAAGGWRLMAALTLPPVAALLALRALSRGWLGSAWLRWAAARAGLRLPYRMGYVLAFGTLLLVGATLPMVVFYQAAFEAETRLVVKHTQLRLAQDLGLRTQRLWGEVSGATGSQRTRSRPLPVTDRPRFFDLLRTNGLDLYAECCFDTTIAGPAREVTANPPLPAPAFWEEWLALLRPHYNEQDLATRSVAGVGAEDGSWFWQTPTSREPRLELVQTGIHVPTHTGEHRLIISTAGPRWARVSWLWGLAFAGLTVLPFFMVYVAADQVLLLRSQPPAAGAGSVLDPDNLAAPAAFGPGRYLLLGPPRSGKSRHLSPEYFAPLQPGAFHRVDLRNPDHQKLLEPDQTDRLLAETDKAIVVDSFEYRHDDAEFTRKKLQFLRQLALDEARTVVVVSNLHPLHFNLTPAAGGKESANQTPAEVAAEWVGVLGAFRRLHVRRRWDPGAFAALEGHTSHQARALYRSLWGTCSPAEQQLLHSVAQGRLVNSHQIELSTLRERGLLRCDPALKVADEPFRRFVLAAYRPGAAVLEASQEAPGLWQSLKGPAITALVILAAFFFATQEEMWNQSVVLITTFLTGIGAFAKAFELFQKSRSKPIPPG